MRTCTQCMLWLLTLLPMLLIAQQKPCTLGVGGRDTETIIQVFQLNDVQQTRMENWIGELMQENKLVEDEIKTLFDSHPQQSSEDLAKLAEKYNALKNQLEERSKMYDRKLLGLFNERQYQRYASLCAEANREPMPRLPEVETALPPEEN